MACGSHPTESAFGGLVAAMEAVGRPSVSDANNSGWSVFAIAPAFDEYG